MSFERGSREELLRTSLEGANIPTLILVIVQLTGDMRWIEPPYLVTRNKGLGDNDTGGLAPDLQAEIRGAALAAILAWQAGAPLAIPDPSPELLTRMMSASMGEPIPDEYADFMAEKLRRVLAPRGPVHQSSPPAGFKALIIGAGMSGICAAIKLGELGVTYEIVERNDEVGGTWWQNCYPGCGVDSPSHLYSYSFARHDWSAYFAQRDEILDYFTDVATDFGIRPHIRFGTEVISSTYEPTTQDWATTVRLPDGSESVIRSNIVITAVGAFNRPKPAGVIGIERFKGLVAHTAQWPSGVDLRGKRVAVIGTGASAMQLVPAVVDEVSSLTIFQRSAQWVAPFEKFHTPISDEQRYLFQTVSPYEVWYRLRLGWIFDNQVYPALQKDPAWPHPDRSVNAVSDTYRRFFTRYILSELGDRNDLAEVAVPTYPPFGKRMLLDNGWFRALVKDQVELVTAPVCEIVESGVRTEDGSLYEADVLVLATGFDVVRFLAPIEIRGRSGQTLRTAWDDDNPRAYLGMTVPDFPNFFMLYGPNTQAGHGGSLVFVIESQVHYICNLLEQMFEAGWASVECRADVYGRYNDTVDAMHENMVWTHPGMDVYYRNRRGRVVVNSPFRGVDFWEMTQKANPSDYNLEPSTTAALSSQAAQH